MKGFLWFFAKGLSGCLFDYVLSEFTQPNKGTCKKLVAMKFRNREKSVAITSKPALLKQKQQHNDQTNHQRNSTTKAICQV